MRRFWYFDVSVWSVDKKPYHSGLCQNSVFTPYCKDWDLIYPPNLFKRLQFPWIPLRYLQTPLRLLPDTHQISPGNMKCQKTTTDAKKHCQTFSKSTCQFLGVFGSVCWCLLVSVGMSCSTEMPWGYQGNVLSVSGGSWVEFMEIGGPQMCFGGYGFSILAVWSENTILAQSWMVRFFVDYHTEISKYQNRRI